MPSPDLIAAAMERYGLTSDPFASPPGDEFFYASPSLMRRIDLITHLVDYGRQVIVVSGPKGSGKTTLLNRLKTRAFQDTRACLISQPDLYDARALLRQLAEALVIPLPGDDVESHRDIVAGKLQMMESSGVALLVMVDDVHAMPDAALKVLLDFASREQCQQAFSLLLTVDWSGTDSASALADDASELYRMIEMPPFSRAETEAYLNARLRAAGLKGASPFDSDQIDAIYAESIGVPGSINSLARAQLIEYEQSLERAATQLAPKRIAVGSVAVIALTGLLYWAFVLREPGEGTVASSSSASDPPTRTEQLPTLVVDDLDRTPLVTESTQAPEPAGESEQTADLGTSAGTDESTAAAEPVSVEVTSPPEVPGDTQPESVEQAEFEVATTVASLEPEEPSVTEASPSVAEAPEAVAEVPPEPDPVEPTPSGTPTAQARDLNWLLSQPEDTFTIQLGAFGSRQSVDRLVASLDLEDVIVGEGTPSGRSLYFVFVGHYETGDASARAIASLPDRLKADSPWRRTIADIRALDLRPFP